MICPGTQHEFVCLIYTFDLFRGRSLVEWLFVIRHYGLHPLACRVGGPGTQTDRFD